MDRSRASLLIDGLSVRYQGAIVALRDVCLEVRSGEVVALLGANGSGKSTLLRALTGMLPVHRGRVAAGSIRLDDREISRASARSIVRAGIAHTMEGRRVFGDLTVDENLRAGALARRGRREIAETREQVYEQLPILRERADQRAGYLSGGQQQLLTIGRALMAAPRMLLLDEPSLGLAPRMVGEVRDVIAGINEMGTTVVLIEQNVTLALSISDRGYVLENGDVVATGTADELAEDERTRTAYLGSEVS